jgi:hypothetical protein
MEKLGLKREALRVGDHVAREGELVDEVVHGLDLPTRVFRREIP